MQTEEEQLDVRLAAPLAFLIFAFNPYLLVDSITDEPLLGLALESPCPLFVCLPGRGLQRKAERVKVA